MPSELRSAPVVGLTALLCGLLPLLPANPASAQLAAPIGDSPPRVPPDSQAKEEARQRFDRGLTLYNQGDATGALAQFQLAYRLTGHPVVLYNLALVRASLGHSAEAVEALEKLRGQPSAELSAAAQARAQALYEEQVARVGWLQIRSSTPRALIQVDNVDVARTPAPPLRLTAGVHFVSVSAPQHEPRHFQVTIAGRATEVLDIELTPLEVPPARLKVTTNVPGVEVRANGTPVGRTPLLQALTLSAGKHELELIRDGYARVRKSLILPPGGAEQLAVRLAPDETGLRESGVLTLRISERDAIVSVDGEPRLDATRGMRLPLGPHSIRVQRAGFFELAREVVVEPGPQTLEATLLPTPDYLSDYVKHARSRRAWSYVALGAGGLVAAGGGAFLLWNQAEKNAAKERFDDYADSIDQLPGGRCPDSACEVSLDIYASDLEAKQGRDTYGWVAVGVGATGAATGVLLWALGDDPGRYDPKPESDVFGSLDFDFHGTRLELRGRF